MKRIYECPELTVITLATRDIVSTSGGRDAILPDDEF